VSELLSQMRMQRQEAAHREVERYTMDPAIQDDIKQVGHHQCSTGRCKQYEDKPRDKTRPLKMFLLSLICVLYGKVSFWQ
jgi:hypothetical protein